MTTHTDDQDLSLYEGRKAIFPKRVTGFYRRLKWAIMLVTLAIYYVTPWIRFPRGGDMPDQAVLIDLANRRFFFFWIEIWPQEFYYVAGLLIMAGLGLFLFTSALGRVWCGYACPQTVWVDLFQHVERWTDGDRNAAYRLLKAPWTLNKVARRALKWSIFLLISVATGGAWVFYFADAPTLAQSLVFGTAPSYAYITIAVLTSTTFVLGGFMREQVCLYMCPWPRIQAAMLDENSLTVTYKNWRGEPRGKHRKREQQAAEASAFAGPVVGERAPFIPLPGRSDANAPKGSNPDAFGDCIDCNACVNVCPTGVDIREGQQLGCITCALCIDACDDIMRKVGKPRGLIDYCSLTDEKQERAGAEPVPIWKRLFRPRLILYSTLWVGIGIAMVVTLFMRDTIDLTVAHDRNPQFVQLSDGSVRNGYVLKVANRETVPNIFRLSITGQPGLIVKVQDADQIAFQIAPDKLRQLRVFVIAPSGWGKLDGGSAPERAPFRFWVENVNTRERESRAVVFVGGDRVADPAP
ncbi:MAG: 4Fe-4S dicluster domain-containing protein [Pseudomonadota bacterium]